MQNDYPHFERRYETMEKYKCPDCGHERRQEAALHCPQCGNIMKAVAAK